MAVLVQPMLAADVGGVLFPIDPVTGEGGVPGLSRSPTAVQGVSPRGRRRPLTIASGMTGSSSAQGEESGPHLSEACLGEVAGLVDRIESWADSSQNVEWVRDEMGNLWIVQSRPLQ